MSQVILITGASKGLGAALAEDFTRLGHRVYTCARSPVEAAFSALSSHHTLLDVCNRQAIQEWVATIVQQEGELNVVINNAGIMNEPAPLWELSPENFDLVVDVNIKGVFNIVQATVPVMLSRGSGLIINLISGSGRKNPARSGAYNLSKTAIESFTKTLANELPEGIGAVALIPGTTNTAMLQKILGEQAHEFPDVADWVARATPFILSLDYTQSGQILTVPGQQAM
ncbi:MAG: SDR family oxidoreductase [Chloroflexota bacterium]